MSSIKPSLENFYEQIEKLFQQTLTKPARDAAEDFWNKWQELLDGISNNNIRINVDMLMLFKKFPEHTKYNQWKGFGILTTVVGIVLFFIHLFSGSIVFLLGVGLFYYSRKVKLNDGQTFQEKMKKNVIENANDNGMADLCAQYIAGTIQLVSNINSAHWPQYPSCVVTGENDLIQTSIKKGAL